MAVNNIKALNACSRNIALFGVPLRPFFSPALSLENLYIRAKALLKVLCYRRKVLLAFRGTDHGAGNFLKSYNAEIEKEFPEMYRKTLQNRFRGNEDITQFFWNQFYIRTGMFSQKKYLNKAIYLTEENKAFAEEIQEAKKSKKYTTLCIQDSFGDDMPLAEIEKVKKDLSKELNKIFPQKSSFEK